MDIPVIDFAILSAMPEELEFLTERFASLNYSTVHINNIAFKIYEYQNSRILIAHTGIGSVFAAGLMTLIHAHCRPSYFLVAGTAGGIKETLRLRDVIVVEHAFEAEIQGIFTSLIGTPFESCLTHPMLNKPIPSEFSADADLVQICETLEVPNINLIKGTMVTSDTFPAPKELFDKIKCSNAYAIDMETSAFYQTAWFLNTKIIAIRGISNFLNVDGTDENVAEADVKGSATAAATVLFSLLNKLISLKQQKTINSIHEEAQRLIKEYNLQPHPEGGYFASIYKSNDTVKPSDSERYQNELRSAGTSIYYLLNENDYSAWHVLKSDEIWHFYKGSPLNIYVINQNGELKTHILGDPILTKGAAFQVCIKAGHYFAAENIDKQSYSLVGCTVSPGFEYADFKLCDKRHLNLLFPQHSKIIDKFLHAEVSNHQSENFTSSMSLRK